MIQLMDILVVATLLFLIGALGVVLRKNAIIVFMSIELMLNACGLLFIGMARLWGNVDGHVMVFFIMAVAAAEVAVGLAIIVGMFRKTESVDLDALKQLKG